MEKEKLITIKILRSAWQVLMEEKAKTNRKLTELASEAILQVFKKGKV
ncbi:MAG: hypothetical protein QW478_10105 [Candidatus Micrarchaeaceae archaeon]